MTFRVISKQGLRDFVDNLISETAVFGVRGKENKYFYDRLTDSAQLCLNYPYTLLPPKKFFFPPREVLLRFKMGASIELEPVIAAEPIVVFGMHPCDIHAISQLDWAFSERNLDSNYLQKRKLASIIGVDCLPDEYCFCASVGTDFVESGYDLFLTPIDDAYLISIGTPKGEELMNKHAETKEASPEDIEKMHAFRERKRQMFRQSLNVDSSFLPLFFQRTYESVVWKEQGDKCLSCGSCNLVCPTCYCFDVLDQVDWSLSKGERLRVWDGCLLPDFAKVATGENFRKERSARLRHRLYRKFQYLMVKYGKSFCVGCGRCTRVCLVHINPAEVVNQLLLRPGGGV